MNNDKPLNPAVCGEHRRAGDPPARPRASPGNGAWLDTHQKRGGRHAAITRNLYSLRGYKTWAEKVRSSWERDK